MWFPCPPNIHSLVHQILKSNAMQVGRQLKRDAVNLAYVKYGSGSNTVLTLHGLLGSKKNWNTISKKIAEGAQSLVYAVDLRNHGDSPHTSTHTYPELAEDVLQLMDKEKISNATIIGHSMGGRTGMIMALTQPSKVRRLVVVDISPISTPGLLSDFFPKLIEAMNRVPFEANQNLTQARNSVKKQLTAEGMDPGGIGFILLNVGVKDGKPGWLINTDALKNEIRKISTFPNDYVVGKQYDGPTLFVGGGESNFLPPSDLPEIQKYFPKARLEYVSNVGHNVHAENPKAFFDLVSKFIKET